MLGLAQQILNDFFLKAVTFSGFEGYDFGTNLLTYAIIVPIAALLGGSFIVFTRERLRALSLKWRILLEILLFAALVFVLTIGGSVVYNSIYLQTFDLDERVLAEVQKTIFSYGMLYNVFYWTFIGGFTVLIFQVIEYYGQQKFRKTFSGKYYRPIVESRIFLFLDLKNSTRLAEQWGHQVWFDFINMFIKDIADPIVDRKGEIYQYVGDEIVISWSQADGFEDNNCVNCFFDIERKIRGREQIYRTRFHAVPEFRASIHHGEVTAGEIGLYRKDIIYTGDVLNTAKRIQGYCDALGCTLLVSEATASKLDTSAFEILQRTEVELKGKENKIKVLSLQPRVV